MTGSLVSCSLALQSYKLLLLPLSSERPSLPFIVIRRKTFNSAVFTQVFVTEVNSHRDHIIELDKTGTHLKYFSQKQDVVLIKNLLLSVQGRWEKLVQRSVERGRLLDDARKRAKQVLFSAFLYSRFEIFLLSELFWRVRSLFSILQLLITFLHNMCGYKIK